jgi:hypothetical protein
LLDQIRKYLSKNEHEMQEHEKKDHLLEDDDE